MRRSSNPKTVCIRHEPGYYDVKRDGKFIGSVTKVAQNKWIAYGNGISLFFPENFRGNKGNL